MGKKERSGFDGTQVVETADFVLFWKPPGVYSQWTESTFEVDGVTYNCAEQFMMASKARLFGDHEVERQIMATSSPKQQKALGRKVSGFDETVWNRECIGLVVRGNMAKFGQNPDLRETLLATGDKTLVEASPMDRIWGVGLRADDGRILDRSQWRGQNLLGRALVEVRERLRAEG
jgi:hypothetical protein